MTRPQAFLNHIVNVKIDRPLGSRHPTHGLIYPVNYGFVPGTPAPDGDDDKLIVVPEGRRYSDEQLQVLVEFQERFFTSIIQR